MSFAAWQRYAGVQTPPRQLVEQQSLGSVQESASVLQALAPGSGWQVVGVPEQRPVQQSVPTLQVVPVALQALSEQRPPTQESEQQSDGLPQSAPGTAQKAVVVHLPPLHAPEQHSPLIVQFRPGSLQVDTAVSHRCESGLQ
jgi:hypothetical protein